MANLMRCVWLSSFVIVIAVSVAAQTSDPRKDCSENANRLLQQAWAAQPMNVPTNNADPTKAESLYRRAINDSPKCRRAMGLLTALFVRAEKYEQANEYNELLLKQYPGDPAGLSEKAYLISILKKDYPFALEIEMKLLDVAGFNKNGNVFYEIARIYSLMDRLDDSLRYLELAMKIERGWGSKANAQIADGFENARKDKRFLTLVKKK
jgi:tetratricopeptide (TPR) repeat protein